MKVFYLLLLVALPALAVDPVETPMLGLEVSSGRLPPVQKRLPQQPLVVSVENLGRHGGTLNSLVGRSRDTRLLVVYGYARLVVYDRNLELVPDILGDERVGIRHKINGLLSLTPDGMPILGETPEVRAWRLGPDSYEELPWRVAPAGVEPGPGPG